MGFGQEERVACGDRLSGRDGEDNSVLEDKLRGRKPSDDSTEEAGIHAKNIQECLL